VSRARLPVILSIAIALVGCDGGDAGLQDDVDTLNQEVASLRGQLDGLTAEVEAMTAVTTTTTTPATTTTTTVPLDEAPAFPPERTSLEHGGDAWVVILGASETSNDPALRAAELAAERAGYTTGATDCDVGADVVLGLPADRHYYTVSVYLESEEDANAARDAFAEWGVGGIPGVVRTFCGD